MNILKKILSETKFELINTEPFQIKRYIFEKPASNKEKKRLITAYKVYNAQLQEIIASNNKSIERLQNEMT